MFAAAVELTIHTLNSNPDSNSLTASLMESAIEGADTIPLDAMVRFVRLAHMYDQRDVMEICGEKVIYLTQISDDEVMVAKGKALQVMLAMELLVNAHHKYVISATQGGPTRRGTSGSLGQAKGRGGSGGTHGGTKRGRVGSAGAALKGAKPQGGGRVGSGGKEGGRSDSAAHNGKGERGVSAYGTRGGPKVEAQGMRKVEGGRVTSASQGRRGGGGGTPSGGKAEGQSTSGGDKGESSTVVEGEAKGQGSTVVEGGVKGQGSSVLVGGGGTQVEVESPAVQMGGGKGESSAVPAMQLEGGPASPLPDQEKAPPPDRERKDEVTGGVDARSTTSSVKAHIS